MTPEYLEQLADIADPDKLWSLPGMKQLELPVEKRKQLDTGVALRRYAEYIRRLNHLYTLEMSMLVTPLGTNSAAVATKGVKTPQEHMKLRR